MTAEPAAASFLGGKLTLTQADGYRAAIDPILLAASLALKPGQHGAEFGCNAGAALLSAALLNPGAHLTGVELDGAAAALARANTSANELESRVSIVECDALSWKPEAQLDAVFFNPPFFDDPNALRAPSPNKREAWINEAGLKTWITAGLKRLREGGRLTLIQRADRLGDILDALSGRAGGVTILPVHPRAGDPAKRVIVSAIKVSKAPLRVLPGLVLHARQGGAYMAEVGAILRGEARTALAAL
ncbi:MAG: methyltransferase [Alphaproteobacteria bacterium]|nr:methyltransferase [Alphaproteobacteria bacterium]